MPPHPESLYKSWKKDIISLDLAISQYADRMVEAGRNYAISLEG